MREPLSVRADADGRCRVIVGAEFDLAVEEPFVELVAARVADGDDEVLVDLRAVDFIDSSGLRALLRVHLDHPGRVVVVDVPDPVRRVLAVAGLESLLVDEGDRR
jgi:anti-anti-sigma factor